MKHLPNPAAESAGKITFANQLRGVAVLCVIITHYFGIYWGARDTVAQYTFAPMLAGPGPRFIGYIAPPTFNYGPFGVALFFLISGFVIPFSLEKMGSLRFLAARALRIFPTYWVATAFMLGVAFLSSLYWGLPFHVDARQLLTNLLLFNAELSLPSIDSVNWTLSIEVKFYVAAVLLWPLLRRAPLLTLLGYAALVLVAILALPGQANIGSLAVSIDFAKVEAMYTVFLFIGTLFHFAARGRLSPRMLVIGVAALFALFVFMWPRTLLVSQYWRVTANYGYALAVFALCYALRRRFRPVRTFDFFAAISYPLYLVHSVAGYALMHILMDRGLPYLAALPLALVLALLAATLLHYAVELPTANAGKTLHRVLDK
ncbi:MAG: acyltransferase [Burkholderiaceae bacterium]|nr:acyltransferase [Burkholderiaceae bacterium]